MSVVTFRITTDIRRYISEHLHNSNNTTHLYSNNDMTNQRFCSLINSIMEDNSDIRLSRRTNGKTILNIRPSVAENKIIVRYNDNTSGTMMIKNFMRNFNVIEVDEWDTDNEDREQDMLLMRLGIRV